MILGAPSIWSAAARRRIRGLAAAVGASLLCWTAVAGAQTLEAVNTPLTAWLDLRPAPPEAAPQTAPSWIESFEFVATKPAAQSRPDHMDFGAGG